MNILIFIFFITIFAKLFMLLNKKKFSEEKYININQRINTWFIIIIVFFLGSLNRKNFLFLFSLISFLACREFLELLNIKINFKRIFYFLFNIFIFYFSIYLKNPLLFLIGFITFLTLIFILEKDWKLFLLTTIINIYMIGAITIIENISLSITLIVLIEINDVFQYITGNLFGKIKITPKISPNKTFEGLLGGITLSTLFSIFIKIFFEKIIIISIIPVVALLGFLGDISISYFKRKYNKKDSGHLLKGHGGILDRVDSLLFTSLFLVFIYSL